MSVQPAVSLRGPKTPEVLARREREFDNLAAIGERQQAESETLRQRTKDAVAQLDERYWELGEFLSTISRDVKYSGWGFRSFRAYVEGELRMPAAKAKRLMRVVTTFHGHQDALRAAGAGWATLSEALPIANAAGVETAIEVASGGRESVREWKEQHRETATTEPGWRTFRMTLPSDVYVQLEELLELVQKVAAHNGGSIDPDRPHQALAAILAEAEPGLRAALPPE